MAEVQVVKPSAVLRQLTPNALELIEEAGRLCYQSDHDGDPAKFVRKIIDRGHESVVEHAVASFRVVCDRGVTHEIVRHRIASYSQESTRYCNYAKEGKRYSGIRIIMPDGLSEEQKQRRLQHFEQMQMLYEMEIAEGVAPQIARGLLPTCLKTEIMITFNLRQWRYFLRLRGGMAAHPQIREVAMLIWNTFEEHCPLLLSGLQKPVV